MLRILTAAGFLLFAGSAAAQEADFQPIPKLAARVTDITETLSADQRRSIETKLADLEHLKGAQIGVLVVPTVKPESIEQYAVRVMETWKLGRKGINDGVLLVVAKQDRKLRIEVGYGLEGALTDAVSKRIISDFITPRFKDGDFVGGIDTGVDKIIAVVSGEALPEPQQDFGDAQDIMLYFFAPALLVLSLGGRVMLRERFGPLKSASMTAAATGSIAWVFLMAVGMGWVALVIAAIAFAMTFVTFKPRIRSHSYAGWYPPGASEPSDSWSGRSPSSGSSSDDSSSSSDSGFSGGGGESGGGGSSGDW